MSSPTQAAALARAYVRRTTEAPTIALLGAVSISVLSGSEDSERLGVYEYTAAAGAPGPVLHWHKESTEWFFVLEGEFTFELNGRTLVAGPQTFAFVPPRTLHRFWNSAPTSSRMLFSFDRKGMEGYFIELLEFAKRLGTWPPKDPAAFAELESIAERYDTFSPAKLNSAESNG